jgi:hypothetical protein
MYVSVVGHKKIPRGKATRKHANTHTHTQTNARYLDRLSTLPVLIHPGFLDSEYIKTNNLEL